jgi:arabinose-5-phosphate isomerase
MTRKGLGMTAIVDERDHVIGVFTDGDLRRALDGATDLRMSRMQEVMTRQVKTVQAGSLAAEAVHIMETHRITALLVADDQGVLIGALNVHDLLRAGVV